MPALRRRYRVALAATAVAAIAGVIAVAGSGATSAGSPPPEVEAAADAWPAHNYDLSNSRATTQTEINSSTVSKLHPVWRFKFKGSGGFGIYATTPIVL